jgi:hypothetical protein
VRGHHLPSFLVSLRSCEMLNDPFRRFNTACVASASHLAEGQRLPSPQSGHLSHTARGMPSALASASVRPVPLLADEFVLPDINRTKLNATGDSRAAETRDMGDSDSACPRFLKKPTRYRGAEGSKVPARERLLDATPPGEISISGTTMHISAFPPCETGHTPRGGGIGLTRSGTLKCEAVRQSNLWSHQPAHARA